jgi:iron-sulfur cluster assembly protein
MFTVTQQAAAQILQAAGQSEAEGMALRIAAKRLPDGSIDYGMGFDEEREQDARVESQGLTLLVSPLSQGLLEGVTLDFVELEPGDFRFIFMASEETAEQSSGCGSGSGGCGSGGCGSGSA